MSGRRSGSADRSHSVGLGGSALRSREGMPERGVFGSSGYAGMKGSTRVAPPGQAPKRQAHGNSPGIPQPPGARDRASVSRSAQRQGSGSERYLRSSSESPSRRSPSTGNAPAVLCRRGRATEMDVEVWVRVRPMSKAEVASDRLRQQHFRASLASSPKGTHPAGGYVGVPPFARHEAVRMYSDAHKGGVTIANPNTKNPAATYRSYCFDRCCWSASQAPSRTGGPFVSQEDLYAPIRPALQDVVNGHNFTVIAYGPSDTGKTYTMFGGRHEQEHGIVPRAACDLLHCATAYNSKGLVRHVIVEVSALAVWRNEAYDLLRASTPASPGRKPDNLLSVHVTAGLRADERVVQLPDLNWLAVYSTEDIDRLLTVCISKRPALSHSVVMFRVTKVFGTSRHGVVGARNDAVGSAEIDPVRKSQAVLTLVDLAGCEDLRKVDPTQRTTSDRVAINKSLSVFRMVFERLASTKHAGADLSPPVRDSTLTKILVNSLGGNSRTLLITHISPHLDRYQETYNTLKFADTAKAVTGLVSPAVPIPSCEERASELRRALQDPWLNAAQREALEDLLEDELAEADAYDDYAARLAGVRAEVRRNRTIQQQVVNQYNLITAKAGAKAQHIDAELEESQGMMKRLMDRLADLERSSRAGGASAANLDAERAILREQLEKAAAERTILSDLKRMLLQKLDLLTFDTLASDELSEQQNLADFSQQLEDDLRSYRSRRGSEMWPHDMAHEDYYDTDRDPMRLNDGDMIDLEVATDRGSMARSTRKGSVAGQQEEPEPAPEKEEDGEKHGLMVWMDTLAALSTRIGKAIDNRDAKETRDLSHCVKELGAAHPKIHGVTLAVSEYLDLMASRKFAPFTNTGESVLDDLFANASSAAATNPPRSAKIGGGSGPYSHADEFDGYGSGEWGASCSKAALRVTELVGQLNRSEAASGKRLRRLEELEGKVADLTHTCQKLISAAKEARRHDLPSGASSALSAALAEVDYRTFTPKPTDSIQRSSFGFSRTEAGSPYASTPADAAAAVPSDVKASIASMTDALNVLLAVDDHLTVFPPAQRGVLSLVAERLRQVDRSGSDESAQAQVIVIRRESAGATRDSATQSDTALLPFDDSDGVGAPKSSYPTRNSSTRDASRPPETDWLDHRTGEDEDAAAGLRDAAARAADLATLVRRDDTIGDKLKELHQVFVACGCPEAGSLADEAARRLALGDVVGCAASLHAASAAGAASMSVYAAPPAPGRLAKLFAELADLQKLLSTGVFVPQARVAQLRDTALQLSGAGPGAAERTACFLAATPLSQTDSAPLVSAASGVARRHPAVAPFMRSLVQAFQGNPSDVQAVAGFSQAAADALYKTRQSHVVMGELLKAVSLARAQPGGKHGERALLSFAEKAAASAVDAAASLGESNSVASLMEAAATCVKDAAQFALDGKWDKAEGAAREAWKTSERACCTGVSSAAATARKLAASCAELRGKAASAAGPEDIRALANTVAQISREASFAAQASLPHAVVTTGLEQCAQLLEAVVDQFRSGVITKDATERAGKAGAAAWGAAEAHAGVRKAMDFCQAATDQLHKGSEAAAGSALTGAMQALGAVEGSAPHPGIASAFRACRERLAQVRVTAGSAPSAAAVQRVYRQLSVAAGDPGAEEATARYIAERLNELLRGLSASQPLPGLLSVVQATMTDAADIMGCDPANPTPNNAPALAFSKELEYAAQVGDPAKVAELVATAQRLSATSGGIVAAAMAQVAERLSGGAPVDDAAALCRTALGAAKSGHDAVRMLKEALGAETLDPQRLKVVSGEVSLLSEGLGGDTEQRLTALSKAVLQLADAPETAETRFELQDALADLSVLAGTATKQDTIAQAFEQVASMVAEYLDQDEKSGNRVPIPFVLKLRLRRLRENAPEYAGWYACLDRVVSLREQQDTDHAKRQAEQRERAQGEAREKQSKRAELLDSLKLQSRHTRATLEALSLPERLEGAATAELRAELYSATLSGLPEQSLMASVLRDAMLAAEPEESVVTSGAGAAVQLADIHTTLTGYRELIRMGETLGAAEAAQLQDLSAQFAATAGALQGDASKAAALRLARDLGQVATGVTQGNPAAAAELLALHDSFSAAVGTAKAPFAGADAAAEAGPGSRRGSAGVDALVAGLDDMVASVQRGAKVDPTALAGLQRLAREATARDPAHAALGEKVSSFCENLLLQQQQQLVQQQGQQLQVQQQGQPAQEPAGGAVAVPLRALAALTADAHAAASEKMDRAQQLLREADLGHVDMADAILAYIEMHRRNHARNPANAADDAAKREAWEQDMSDVVAKLRGGDSSIAEQVDEALGRLRSSSLSMTALAAEATEMFERKDFAGLAGVLETAVILQREVGKGTELPPLDETRCRLPKLATVLTAVASLKKKVESPSGYDSAALLEELQVVQSMALAAGGMGPGLAERACGGLRGAPATKEGAELCNEAAQRHRIPQLSMAARCLADGDAAAAAAAAEPVQQTLHLARKVAAKCKDLAWAISTGAPSASLPSLLHPLSNSTRQLCAKLDILELPYPKPAIEDLLAKLEAPQDPPDGRTTLNHLSALSDLLEQTAQAGTHSAALSLNRIALSLDAIAAGIKPAPKDAPHAGLPAKTTASLLAVRAELKALAETVSDKSVLHAAATTAIAGYLPLLSGGDEAACIKRFAGRLRHAVDLQRDVGAAAAAAETGVRRFLAHDAAGGLAMIKQAYDSVGERLRAFDDGFVEDLKEMATSTGQDTPVVLLAGEADFIVERLTAWAGTPLPEHTAARLVASRLDDLAATLKGDTPAGGAHALQAMVETALVVAGPAPSPGEARTAALRDALAEKAAREAGGDEAAAEAYSDALAQVAALGDAAGGVGAAMRAVRAELDARPGCGKAELAECRALVESVGFATQRVRGVAGRLRGLAHRAAGAVTSDGLTLLSGVCLSVVACLPGESGGDVVALAEDLGALAGRVGSGGVDTAVELAPVCEQALRIAGLLGGLQTETDGLFAQTAAGQAEADAVLGALRAAVDSGAVTLGSVAALAAPADAPPAGFGAAFAGFAADFSAFHPPGAPPPAAGDPTQCLLALRVVEAAKRVGGGEAGTAAGAMARALASRYLAHAGEPSLAESLRAVLPVLPAGDVRSALAGNLEAVEKLAEKLSGASEMAALAEGVSGGVKDALHLVVETAKAGGPVEAVIRAAELALAAGCDAPLVQSFAADVRQAHEQLALSALQAARRRDTPSHARHALHNAAAPAIIQAKLPPFREVSAGVPQGSFSSGGEICCKLQQNEGQGGADEAAVADVLQLVRVDDEDYIQVVEQTVRDLEGSVKELKALATERGADESEREAALLQLRDELAGARGEASRISDKMEDLERAVDLRNGRIAELEDACSSLESQLQDLERDAAGHTEASALARADLETSAQIVAQKDAELAELRESLGKATKQFEERSTRDRGTMEVVLHSATLTTELRGSVEKSYEKGLEEDATRVLREMYESQNLPPDVHERVERVLEREGALEEKVEVIKQGFAPSVGVELRSRACSVVRAVEGLDADSGGLGSIAGVAWELAQDVRRGDADAPALEETIRKLAERFAAEKSPVAAALAQEAVRRVHDGDHHAASAILQQASTTAAQHSAHHVPVHPRLAKLFADLSTLHRKLSLGTPVSTAQIIKLRSRALELAALGSSPAESCLQYFHDAAGTFNPPPDLFPGLARAAAAAAPHHPEIALLLQEYADALEGAGGGAAAAKGLEAKLQGYEQAKLLFVRVSELSRRVCLGEVGAAVVKGVEDALEGAHEVIGVLEKEADGGDGQAGLALCEESLRKAVENLRRGDPAAAELAAAVSCVGSFVTHGVTPAVVHARSLAALCKTLLDPTAHPEPHARTQHALLLSHQLSKLSYSLPAKSILSCALQDAAAKLEHAQDPAAADLLNQAITAQEKLDRAGQKVGQAAALLKDDDPDDEDGESEDPPPDREAVKLLLHAKEALEAAKLTAGEARLDAEFATLSRAECALDGLIARFDGGSRPFPSRSDVMTILNTDLLPALGHAGGDEAAAQLIAERLTNLLDRLRQGEAETTAAGVLSQFPSPESMAAATQTFAEADPAAARKIGFSALIETTESVRPPSPTDTATSMQTDAMQQGGGAGGSHHQSPPDIGLSAAECVALAMGRSLLELRRELESEGKTERMVEEIGRVYRELDAKARTLPAGSVCRAVLEDVRAALEGAMVAHDDNAQEDAEADGDQQPKTGHKTLVDTLKRARDDCIAGADTSKVARRMARGLWGLESKIASEGRVGEEDWSRLRQVAEKGLRGVKGEQGPKRLLAEWAAEIDGTAASAVTAASVGRLCDAAALAAGLPVRGATGTAADLFDKISLLCERGPPPTLTDLQLLGQQAAAAATRHPEIDAFGSFSDELAAAVAAAQTAQRSPADSAGDISREILQPFLNKAGELRAELERPRGQDVAVQWPDAEGLMQEEESVQKLRTTLGKQMQEEMGKLNARWKKKLAEAEAAKQEIDFEMAAVAEVLAETEIERDTLADRVEELEAEIKALNADVDAGIDDILADRELSIKQQDELLQASRGDVLETGEALERFDIELEEQESRTVHSHTARNRVMDQWKRLRQELNESVDQWTAEEANFQTRLKEAGDAAEILEGAVSRREDEARRLQIEIEEVLKVVSDDRDEHEREMLDLQRQLRDQAEALAIFEAGGSADDAADTLATSFKTELDAAQAARAAAEKKLKEAQHAAKALREELRVSAEASVDLRGKLQSTAAKLEAAEAALQDEKRAKSAVEAELAAVPSVPAAPAKDEQPAADGAKVAALEEEKARLEKALAELEKAHASLEEEAAEALERADVEATRLKADLHEAQEMIAELSDALETS